MSAVCAYLYEVLVFFCLLNGEFAMARGGIGLGLGKKESEEIEGACARACMLLVSLQSVYLVRYM